MPQDFSRYDAYLDALGLIYYEDDSSRKSEQSIPLQPPRQDIGLSGAEQRPEVGDIFAQADFSHGVGQHNFHQPGRDPKKYLHSEGFDITSPGKLTHLHDTAQVSTGSVGTTAGAIVQVLDLPFVADNQRVKKGDGAWPGAWTSENPRGPEGTDITVYDLCTSGDTIYAATSHGIHRRDNTGTWTHYNSLAVTGGKIAYLRDRLIVTDGRSIYEVVSGSTPPALQTLPTGWTFEDLFEVGDYIYACAVSTGSGLSRIYHYGLNQAASAIETKGSTPIPSGQLIYSGVGYPQTLLGGGKRNAAGGYEPIVYQALPDARGFLSLVKLAEGDPTSDTGDFSVKVFFPLGETILFGWSHVAGPSPVGARTGLALLHLGRSALAPHLKAAGSPVQVAHHGLLFYKGRILFSAGGLFYEDTSKYVAQAKLWSSVADWNNVGLKVWDRFEASHKALAASTSVVLDYSVKDPDQNTWTTALTSDVAGDEGKTASLTNVPKSRLLAVQLTSNANGAQTSAPTVLGFSVRSNPSVDLSQIEHRLIRHVRVMAEDVKDDYTEAVFQDPVVTKKALEDLLYTWVTLYEPGFTWKVYVEGVQGLEPALAKVAATGGEPEKNVFVVALILRGTRQ